MKAEEREGRGQGDNEADQREDAFSVSIRTKAKGYRELDHDKPEEHTDSECQSLPRTVLPECGVGADAGNPLIHDVLPTSFVTVGDCAAALQSTGDKAPAVLRQSKSCERSKFAIRASPLPLCGFPG